MKFFAAVCPALSVHAYDGVLYAKLPDGRLVAPVYQSGEALLVKCGGALRAMAESAAAKFDGGRVVELDCAHWPSDRDVEAALAC